ncbi:MAG TPA: serine/threonine-protein kinase, partial [Bryobacteraceae bacterium]|nr:serine/threonine-protein kinase [Bryobacteraceae bacterium]
MIDEVRRNPQRWLRVQELFEAGLGLTPAARRHMLDQRCHDDEAVRSEVESLLDGADLTGDRIAQAVQQAADGLFRRGEPETGEDVGAYRIEKRLGSGGMGTVYLAHRADGEFQRTVAVKIIRTDLAGRADLLLRFKRERQILADLDHPNIARMLDGGVTQAGFPYFVMEYVRGEPILTYCAQHELSLDQRLALFSTLCAAVTYAHSQGIIHRDIKPGNVLVTLDGVPKLLDFGIAKLTVGAAGGSAAETATVERLMTPDYASPEILRGEPASEASDVYALGVLLYEMVAGRHPWRESGQSSRSVLQRISAGDALPPAQHPGRMSSPLPAGSGRDLNAIVMRAMKASPADRHPSVQALAEDVSRFRAVRLVPMNHRLSVLRMAQIASRRLTSAAAYVDNFVRLRPWDGWVATAATASVALLTLPFAVDHLREQQSPPTPVRFQIESSSDTRFANVSLSPDGRRLALVGMQTHGSDRLWVRALHSVEPKPVPGTDGIRGVPIWSPDSKFVAIGTPGTLKRIDVSGGPPQTMCDMPHALAGGAWASDGRIVFGAIGGGLSKADVAGNCSQLTALDS